ncbi:glycosyltransferase family 2 protein [Candidatus Micrarchaeota archaeon]|nr:glycosyltransferase family 2 protein [Candidatus Micrarchaeota archaeon]
MPIDLKSFLEYALAFLTIFVTVLFLLVFLKNRKNISFTPEAKKLRSITVLIPTFNDGETIKETIESVLKVDYPRNLLEVIVINDGSTDDTLEKLKSFGKKITLLNKTNGGKANALNLGLKHAKGEIIATLDSDSYVAEDSFKKMIGFFDDESVGAVTSNMKVWKPSRFIEKLQNVEYILTVFSRRLLSFLDAINVTPGPLSMIRKKVFDQIGGYDEQNILEDQEIALRIQAHHWRIEASLEAKVYTATPKTFSGLVRQRVRWHRGGIRNIVKHYYLVGRNYGDFGVMFMPLGIITIFVLFAVFAVFFYSLFNGFAPLELLSFGTESLWLGLTPIHVISFIIFAISIVWMFIGLSNMKETVSIPYLLLYLIVYAPIVTLFWVVTLWKELTRQKLEW